MRASRHHVVGDRVMVVASSRYRARQGAILATCLKLIQLVVILHAPLAVPHIARAELVQWVGPAGQLGLWSDPANWSPSVPTANSDVLFDLAAPDQPALVDLSGPNQAAAGTLTVRGGGVQFLGPGALNVSSAVTIGGVNQSPEFIIRSQATVNALGGLNALSGETQVGFANAAGTLNVSGNLFIGDIAKKTSASFRVGGGSSVNADFGVIESGDATIEASGMLAANQELMISTNGVLRGNGIVTGDVENGGVVEPGQSIGELTVDGDFVQLDDGELVIELQGNLADRLIVSETATFGGTLRLVLIDSPIIGQQFDVIVTGGETIWQFDQVDLPLTTLASFSITADSQSVKSETGLTGDMDGSGTVDREDIDDFVVALIDPDLFMRSHDWLNSTRGDFRGVSAEPDGQVDLLDVSSFEQALRDAGVEASLAALFGIPEPPSCMLAIVGLCGWFTFARSGRR